MSSGDQYAVAKIIYYYLWQWCATHRYNLIQREIEKCCHILSRSTGGYFYGNLFLENLYITNVFEGNHSKIFIISKPRNVGCSPEQRRVCRAEFNVGNSVCLSRALQASITVTKAASSMSISR